MQRVVAVPGRVKSLLRFLSTTFSASFFSFIAISLKRGFDLAASLRTYIGFWVMSIKFLPWTSANEFLSIEMVNSVEIVFRCYGERGRRFFRILDIGVIG